MNITSTTPGIDISPTHVSKQDTGYRLNCSCNCKQSNNSLQNHQHKVCAPLSIKKSVHVFLLVIIISSVDGIDQRNAIRETWMSGYSTLVPKVLVKFVIGTVGLSNKTIGQLRNEKDEFNDVILLDDLQESYQNLSLKVLRTFVHVDKEFNITYLFKGDDDTFILLNDVLQELANRESKSSYYWGYFNGKARVKKGGKWKETNWFLSDRYLPYALGGGYVISGDLLHYIAVNAKGLQLYHSEDVSVGVWLSGFVAERKHDVRFNTEFVSRGCRNIYLVSHKQSVHDMKSKYYNMQKTGKQCQKEYQTRHSYIYNWTVPPSECCKRTPNVP